ncbi:AAA family ATPase [Arthrobacter oryzae]|uniref:Putative kinase n=1 Tax=Arthrobacter oryzae TaxID=409290 RepID=A0A495FMP8_9MICC|nr:ATP-binding protein [Arthrobacter oryzae]RKR30001.1 putative kinase [Arthrobacter oryzae]
MDSYANQKATRRPAMVHPRPTVHLLCGLNGAGKTTLARELQTALPAVRFSLDEWMLRLYPGVHFAAAEYAGLAETCKLLIWETARQVLDSGTDVVLDWNQWSPQRRALWREKAAAAGFPAVLHHVQTPLETAIERVVTRTAGGDPWAHRLDAGGVRHLAGIFEPPGPDEGLEIRSVSGR